jgi:TM2 domain-containing membrane protein YozV
MLYRENHWPVTSVVSFIYTALCDKVYQWLVTGRWFSLYSIMWYSLSMTCDRSVVFSIQHYVIKFINDLWQVSGFLYTALCDKVYQWLVAGWWFSLYSIMWSSLSMTCGRLVVFSIQHYVIKFISDLWQVGGFLYTALCDKVYQWLVAVEKTTNLPQVTDKLYHIMLYRENHQPATSHW